MTSIVVIQARTSSSRLPAKVLLPVAGMPMVVLCAQRAASTGRKVIVVTSTDISDDYLVDVLRTHGIEYFRGDLGNTLLRFVDALHEYDDETVVFRLTADNVLPDGPLLDEIEQDFLQRNLQYLGCNGTNSGLPYGMSAEVMRLISLRTADKNSQTAYDQEHVTPSIIRQHGARYFEKYLDWNMGHYRCTVDNLDDYLGVTRLFKDVHNPISILGMKLVEKLKGQPLQPMSGQAVPKLVLGTAQMGMQYGIANKNGKPKQAVADELIKIAIVNGVEWIDTARIYGDSETVICNAVRGGWQGRAKVVTKLAPLTKLAPDSMQEHVNTAVDASVFQSLSALGVNQIDALLLHRAEHLQSHQGKIWSRVLEHQEQGRIKSVGVSVQTPSELRSALDIEQVTHIQMPLNILDWRWCDLEEKIKKTKTARNLVIHIRSIYLQGLLLSLDESMWTRAGAVDAATLCEKLEALRKNVGCSTLQELCIAYINGLDWVDGLVIGVETPAQLNENIRLMKSKSLTKEQIDKLKTERPILAESVLNPATWKK